MPASGLLSIEAMKMESGRLQPARRHKCQHVRERRRSRRIRRSPAHLGSVRSSRSNATTKARRHEKEVSWQVDAFVMNGNTG